MAEPDKTWSGPVHILTHEFAPFTGGIAVYIEETARAAAALGANPTVWAPDYGKQSADRYPFAVRRFPGRGRQDWICRRQLGRALRSAFPDGRMPGTILLAEPGPLRLFLYRSWLGLPVPERLVIILHGSEIAGLSRVPHRRLLLRRLLRQAELVGVISGTVGHMAQRLCPGLEPVLVPGAVRRDWRELPVPERRDCPDPVRVIQVGRVHPRKGQHILLEAVARLPGNLRGQLQIRLLGPLVRPAYADRLRNLIRHEGLPATLEGPVSHRDLLESYAGADLLVMPSRPYRNSIEGFGLTLVEAQHFGCAVIGSRIGGIAETMVEGKSGLLVAPDDVAELAAALESLIRDPQRRRAMGLVGSRLVRERFSWETNVRRLGLG